MLALWWMRALGGTEREGAVEFMCQAVTAPLVMRSEGVMLGSCRCWTRAITWWACRGSIPSGVTCLAN